MTGSPTSVSAATRATRASPGPTTRPTSTWPPSSPPGRRQSVSRTWTGSYQTVHTRSGRPSFERFWQWVDDTTPVEETPASLAALFHHVRTFWPATTSAPNLIMLHYDDLQADLERQMRHLAQRLGIDVPEQRWPQLVPAARFNEMRRRADDLVPNRGDALWHDNAQFFHRGTSGQWRTRLTADDLHRYHLRVTEFGDPEVAGWAHREQPAG